MTTDPLGLAVDVEAATERLLATARGLTDQTAPSRLPGWTVGHVLTHVARNADGLLNLLTWARTGVRTPQYPSAEARAAGVEAGAHRPMDEQIADLEASRSRFAAGVAAMPAAGWTRPVEAFNAPAQPAALVVWSRLREVEVHHVDVGAGYGPADWSEAFSVRMMHTLTHDLPLRTDWPAMVLRMPEIEHDVAIGSGDDSTPVVSGPAWAVVAWLTGRSDGGELVGTLPPVPAWR